MRPALALTLALLVATPAHAQDGAARPSGPWADVLTPPRDDVTIRDARRLVRQGLFLLLEALGRRSELSDAPWVQLDQALARFERARPLLPDDVDLAFYTAVALERWEQPTVEGGVERRVDDAMAAWQRVRELAPDYNAARVAFSLANCHARRLELEEATAEYQIALAVDVPEAAIFMYRTYLPNPLEVRLAALYFALQPATVHANLAENLMLLGNLDAAIHHYRFSRREAQDPDARALTLWGLALARHRAGDAEAALADAREAIAVDPVAGDPDHVEIQRRWGAFAVLHHPDVFFEPAYEVHAYQAIGYEAYATTNERSRRAGLDAALTSWRRFLAEGGVASRFAAHARAQIQRLEGEVAQLPAAPAPLGNPGFAQANEPWLGPP